MNVDFPALFISWIACETDATVERIVKSAVFHTQLYRYWKVMLQENMIIFSSILLLFLRYFTYKQSTLNLNSNVIIYFQAANWSEITRFG